MRGAGRSRWRLSLRSGRTRRGLFLETVQLLQLLGAGLSAPRFPAEFGQACDSLLRLVRPLLRLVRSLLGLVAGGLQFLEGEKAPPVRPGDHHLRARQVK